MKSGDAGVGEEARACGHRVDGKHLVKFEEMQADPGSKGCQLLGGGICPNAISRVAFDHQVGRRGREWRGGRVRAFGCVREGHCHARRRWECCGGALWFDHERLSMKSGGATPVREERVGVLRQG